ncbi:eukaryotic translation initiation factor 2-alpha kinase 3 isoform X3 [Rhipicephalus microplus]|uniref:eukaryotic translation initiation factor 2-alpha kinase 3 isoform X3 n=1 Tax=Rhipicephalus microplus TaxID=6941 RepID=UPI003F6CFAEB
MRRRCWKRERIAYERTARLLPSSETKRREKDVPMRNRGQRVRLVPSLDGSLYKFDGDTVEPLPMSADFLLKSSYRLGDDLVITGGKEARTYGINVHTGQVRYICTMSGCDNTKEDFSTEDVLVVKRNTQTVRAVEPRSGREKWNFSVGENQLTVLKGLMASCSGSSSSDSSDTDSYVVEEPSNCSSGESCSKESLIQVVVPEGLVASTSKSKGSLEWSVKLPSPVVGAWHLRNGELEVVDLFEHSRILGLDGPNQSKQNNPVLYLGMHERQLYVQHSGNIRSEVSGGYSQLIDPHRSNLPQVEWKPYLASAPSRTPIINTGNKAAPPMLEQSSSSRKALMIKDDILDYPFDTGYYLYRGVDLDNDSVLLCEKEEVAETLNEHIVKSLRFWWKEISLIVLATFMINIFITKHVLRRFKLKHLQELSSKETKSNSGSESAVIPVSEQPVGQPSVDVGSTLGDLPKYTSRYLADFEPVRCLGKGGFGLVLESRNKLDDCTYAVKRICLPNNPEARDKVMREAKALAKLDHSGIVRYYNAWLESPPPGWQEHQDDVWQGSFDTCTTSSSFDKTTTSAAKDSSWGNATRPFNPLRPFEDQFSFGDIGHGSAVLSSMNSSSSGITTDRHTSDDRSLCVPFSAYAATDEDDSMIQFEHSGKDVKEQSISKSSAKPKENGERPKSLSLPEQTPMKVYLYIQMQLCKKESLKEWLHAHSTDRDYESVLDIFYQIVSAVEYVHDNGLIHRDLKPSNIFFAMDDAIKVGDFGLVTALTGGSVVATPLEAPSGDIFSSKSGRLTDQVGTQLYMSPEQIDGLKYNQSVDIFSLGLIFFELLWPFSTQMERIQVLMNVKRLIFPPKFVKTYANECKLIEKLLSHDSEKRPSAKDIRQHPLFRAFQPSDEIAHLARLRRRNLSHRQSSSLSE